MSSETIHEERYEDSEQNTKRESTIPNNASKKSTNNLHFEIQPLQQPVTQAMSSKSKSLLTLNLESTENLKKAANDSKILNGGNQNIAAPTQQTSDISEIKGNTILQALKEQLKSQIAKQHHVFSNPNQPSSQNEAEDI